MIEYEDQTEADEDEAVDEVDEDDSLYVVMVGNMSTGYRPVGPFGSFDIAQDWAEANIGLVDLTWVIPLCDPASPKALNP